MVGVGSSYSWSCGDGTTVVLGGATKRSGIEPVWTSSLDLQTGVLVTERNSPYDCEGEFLLLLQWQFAMASHYRVFDGMGMNRMFRGFMDLRRDTKVC